MLVHFLSVYEVTIMPDAEGLTRGQVKPQAGSVPSFDRRIKISVVWPDRPRRSISSLEPEVRARLDAQIQSRLAGPIGERKIRNASVPWSWDLRHSIRQIYFASNPDWKETLHYLRAMADRADELLEENWWYVDLLARELLRRKTLSGAEVDMILGSVRGAEGSALLPRFSGAASSSASGGAVLR
jgi:hypothetical protein